MYHRGGGNPNEGGFNDSDHPDDEINMMETTDSDPTPPPIHRSSNHPLGASSSSVQQQQQQHMTSSLASKPHAFGGAVLSPDHARNLTTDLVLQLSSALSVQASHAASSRGILPPNNRSGTTTENISNNINLFKGSDLVNVLTAGWGIQQASASAQTNVAGGGASGVFRTATTTPGTPNNNKSNTTNQSSTSLPPHILQLLQTGGISSSNASVTGGGLGTSKIFSTPGTSTPGSTTTTSIPNSPMNTPIIDHHQQQQQQQLNNNININPLSLLSTSEALESFTSWRTHYTTWITEAWNILKWSEPSAALFWEMATMFHTLYVASLSVRGGGSGAAVRERVLGGNSSSSLGGGGGNASVSGGSSVASGSGSGTAVMKRQVLMTPSSTSNYIPPLLSCGSQSSMGSVRSVDPLSVSANERKEGGQDIFNNNKIVQSPHATNASSSRSGGGGAMKPARHSAKELPVWLISMFLLVHCEMEAFLRCTSGEDERRFLDGNSSASMSPTGEQGGSSTDGGGGSSSLDFSALLHHRALSPRTRLHAGTHQNNANCASFLLRHLRKFILLCAVPRNVAACKAIASLAARSSSQNNASNAGNRSNVHRYSGTGSNIDIASIDKQHEVEHGSIGLDIELTVEELDRLHLVLQAPSGGLVDEPPIAIGEHVLKCLALEEIEAREGKPSNAPSSHRWNLMQNGLITVADAERVLRRYLEEELTMAKAELDGDDNQHDGVTPTSEDIASKLSKLSIGQQEVSDTVSSSSRITPIQPLSPRSRGISIAESTDADGNKDSSSYLKELSYQKLRSTTVLLEPGNATSDTHNDTDGNSSAASLDQHSQASSTRSHQGGSGKAAATNESGRLHDLHVADCSDTHFYLLQPFEHATIAACTDCTIVLGAVAGILHVVDCERTTITSAARRVVVSNSFDVVHYLFTPSPPLLVGDNRGCQFAPYNTYYEGLREDLLATGLAAVLRSASSAGSSSGSVAGDTTASPGRGYGGDVGGRTSPTSTAPTLQCASNKWKSPVELCKIEVPQLPNVQTPGSPSLESSGSLSPGADDRALGGSADTTMKTPVLLPSSEFDVLLVPVESEEARVQRQMMRESQEAEAANANNEEENPVSEGGGEDEVGETTTVYSTTSSLTGVTGERKGGGQKPQPESDYCRILADLLTFSPFHMPHDYERRVIAKAERVRGLQQAMQELNDEQRTSLQDELNRGFQDWLVTSGNLRQVLDLIHLEKGVAA